MARGINKVTLIGNLGGDPSFKTFSNGGSVTNISLATSEVWKKDGETKERTEWHNVVFHNGLAEVANKYLQKGSRIYLEGSIRSRKYEDKEGKERTVYEIHAYEMNLLDAAKQNGTPAPIDAGAPQKDDDVPF
jgi:single-strand DNA-binding protein